MVFKKLRDCQSYLEYWNTGILEYWLKPHNFCIWVKAFGINFYDFSMDVLIGTKDYGTFVAITALPYPPETDPVLISKNFSKPKMRCLGIRQTWPQNVH
jgi:hypothetical protein